VSRFSLAFLSFPPSPPSLADLSLPIMLLQNLGSPRSSPSTRPELLFRHAFSSPNYLLLSRPQLFSSFLIFSLLFTLGSSASLFSQTTLSFVSGIMEHLSAYTYLLSIPTILFNAREERNSDLVLNLDASHRLDLRLRSLYGIRSVVQVSRIAISYLVAFISDKVLSQEAG